MNPLPPSVPPPPPIPAASVAAGPIRDLTYRGYDGPLNPPTFRWWTVCKMSLNLIWRKPWFWLIGAIPILPYFLHGVLFYFVIFPMFKRIGESEQTMTMMPQFAEILKQQYALQMYSAFTGNLNSMVLLTIAIIVAAGNPGIAADNRANALLIYLSKPLRKGDYLFGKWMTYALSVFVVTAVPAVIFFLFMMTSFASDGFWKDAPHLWLQTLAILAIPAIFHASLLLGISAWTRSPRMVATIYVGLNFITWIVALIARSFFPANSWQRALAEKCSIQGIIDGIVQNILQAKELSGFGRRTMQAGTLPHLQALPHVTPLAIVGGILIVVSIVAARMKIHAVEVVKG